MVNDTISDMLTRIRNANQMKYEKVEVIGTKITLEIARILKEEGYIIDFEEVKNPNGNKLILTLKYSDNKKERVITNLKRISKPGLRVYAAKDELPKVLGGLGIALISTSTGVITDKEARKAGVGGEVLAFVW